MLQILQANTTQNLEFARALFKEYAASLGFDLDFQNFKEELANLPGDYAPPGGRLLIALWREQLSGCVALRNLKDRICEMKRLYVRPQFRGKGIGKALAEAIIEKAREIGYFRMCLDTISSMDRARALYLSLGFKEITPYRYNPVKWATFMELAL